MADDPIETVEELEERLSRPPQAVIEDLAQLEGDLVILGAGGKMGPSLARMARRALDLAGNRARVFAVARFTTAGVREQLEGWNVTTVASCDLLDRDKVRELPDAAAVMFLAGKKFGTSEAPSLTWAMNAWMPGLVAERYRAVPTVVFSSGNVYPLVPIETGGATEETPPSPLGEYAWSVLARERVFEHVARAAGTPALFYRLNYACECRYGVPVDVARKVFAGEPIDLAMGHVNVIWQGDANAMALRCLSLAEAPPKILNVTGGEVVSIRELATHLGERLGRTPVFRGTEQPTALLASAAKAYAQLGPSEVSVDQLVEWVADWVRRDGPFLEHPTHFETRDGSF